MRDNVFHMILILIAALSASGIALRPSLASTRLPASQAETDRPANPIPEASVECSAEVEKWWGQLRETGLQLVQLDKQHFRALDEVHTAQSANPNMNDQEYRSLWERTIVPVEKAIRERSEQFRNILKDGTTRGYRAPVANSNPIIVHAESPRYTEEARKNGIQGQVTLRALLQADGRVTNIHVIKGLGYGLDEQAVIAVSKMVFLPRIVEGRLEAKATALAAEFNLR